MKPPRSVSVLMAAALAASGCALERLTRSVAPPEQLGALDRRSEYLKAHTLDGRLYVLSKWSVDETSKVVTGEGKLLDANRAVVETGVLQVPLGSVALFETNVVQTSPSVTALTIVTGVSAIVTIACLANPKACFGSCPTFYVSDGERSLLQAEGFSASVAPSLEARDVDHLFRARAASRDFEVRMTNEAFETHVVRHVRLLAAPRAPGTRVFQSASGDFQQALELLEPRSCAAAEGECLDAVRQLDGKERFSEADAHDLAQREIVELTFPEAAGAGALGVVVGARQTLLSTYLLYQTLAYMGRSASGWLATLEREHATLLTRARGVTDALGKIEVLAEDGAGRWRSVGELGETGPLATDVKLVRLPPGRHEKLRLRLTRGHWRIDYVALAQLGSRVQPLLLEPEAVEWQPGPYSAGRSPALAGGGLVTLPGDAAKFRYRLPSDFASYELFLDSRGYYLEWMRDEWLAEEQPARVVSLLRDPRRALRELAPEFKKREAHMEELFWQSRYVP